MLFFKAETGKAFTTVLAGCAFTMTSLPKAILFPAFLAGFCLVLIMQTPGMTNFPADFTSLVAMAAKLSMSLEQAVFFISNSSARAPAMAPLVMALPVVFMVFGGHREILRQTLK